MNKNQNDDGIRNRKTTKQDNTPVAKNDEKKQPEEVKPKNPPKVRRIPFFFSILFAIYELSNIIIYLILLFNRSTFIKQEFYDPELCQPDSVIKVYHFIFHLFVIIFIAFLMIFAYKDIINKHPYMISISTVISGLLVFIFLSAYVGVYFVTTKYNKHTISINELNKLLNSTSPIEFGFIYSKEFIRIHNTTTNPLTGLPVYTDQYSYCYSYNGLKFPLKSQLAEAEPYHISNQYKFFYFKIEQILNMSDDYQNQLNQTLAQIKQCNTYNQKVRYFPILNKTFAVANPDIPPLITEKMRKVSAFLGLGYSYELYIKSLPVLKYKQRINIDLDPDIIYSRLWTKKSCKEYGKCSVLNKRRPFPIDDL